MIVSRLLEDRTVEVTSAKLGVSVFHLASGGVVKDKARRSGPLLREALEKGAEFEVPGFGSARMLRLEKR